MDEASPITDVKGVGEAAAKKFAILGVKTVHDLINHYPRRYEDYSVITPIKKLRPGPVSLRVIMKSAAGRYVRRGLHITEAVASDDTGNIRLVWFNQPYRAASLKTGAEYFVSGEYEFKSGRLSVMNPSAELVSDLPISTARILPIYRETKGLTSRQIRAAMIHAKPLIASLPETLPSPLVKSQRLLSRSAALLGLHFPESSKDIDAARSRLGFEEVFALSLAGQLNRREAAEGKGEPIPFDEQLTRSFVAKLPFRLTDQQRAIVWRIYQDMAKPSPMNRLVEGDVGSGKTVVAVMASLAVLAGGRQVAFMAPTEILARQHYDTIKKLLKPLGLDSTLTLLIGTLTPVQKKQVQSDIASGKKQFIVGTHALLQEKVSFKHLALTIVDEQHRFGVQQRKALQQKAGFMPHVLHLSATPIPRTLALTLYGELSISRLTEKPTGREPVLTKIVPFGGRPQLYRDMTKELQKGRQVFVVCPLITDSEVLSSTSAEKSYEVMKKAFPGYVVDLLHGKLKGEQKAAIMQDFLHKKTHILVSTTVIEVGVDVPNASIMVIESAERFGLAQIHQLRGRVGRGNHAGYCYLLLEQGQEAPSRRLRALESSGDGFRLAELDLQLRGPGALYGQAQHGQLDLRIANLSDLSLVKSARAAAEDFIEKKSDLKDYPELAKIVERLRTVTNIN